MNCPTRVEFHRWDSNDPTSGLRRLDTRNDTGARDLVPFSVFSQNAIFLDIDFDDFVQSSRSHKMRDDVNIR